MRTKEIREKIARRTSERTKTLAERNRCPLCQRKAGLVMKFNTKGHIEICKYRDCSYQKQVIME